MKDEEVYKRIIEYDDEKSIRRVTWRDSKNYLSNPDGPAVIEYNVHGRIVREEWRRSGELDRSHFDQPTLIEYDWDNMIRCEEFHLLGKLHRANGPAIIHFDMQTNNIIFQKCFRIDSKFIP